MVFQKGLKTTDFWKNMSTFFFWFDEACTVSLEGSTLGWDFVHPVVGTDSILKLYILCRYFLFKMELKTENLLYFWNSLIETIFNTIYKNI